MSGQLTPILSPCIYFLLAVWLRISSIWLALLIYWPFPHPGPDLANCLVSSHCSCKQAGAQPPSRALRTWLRFNPHFGSTKPHLTQQLSISYCHTQHSICKMHQNKEHRLVSWCSLLSCRYLGILVKSLASTHVRHVIFLKEKFLCPRAACKFWPFP